MCEKENVGNENATQTCRGKKVEKENVARIAGENAEKENVAQKRGVEKTEK